MLISATSVATWWMEAIANKNLFKNGITVYSKSYRVGLFGFYGIPVPQINLVYCIFYPVCW